MDVLGFFLSDRAAFGSLIEKLEDDTGIYIGPSAQRINDYYTGKSETLSERQKPAAKIPPSVLESLDRLLAVNNETWTDTVEAVMSEPNKTWARLHSVERKFRANQRPRRVRLVTKDSGLAAWIEQDASGIISLDVRYSAAARLPLGEGGVPE
jgi:hypothetical protein